MGRFGIVVNACKLAQHNLVLLLCFERLFVRVASPHLRCADFHFLMGGFREAFFWKGTSECPICRKPCPLKESNDLSKEQDMLIENLREVKFAYEEFSNHPKSEGLAHDFVHAFGSSVVLAHPNGEELDLQVGCHIGLLCSCCSFPCTHYRMVSCFR